MCKIIEIIPSDVNSPNSRIDDYLVQDNDNLIWNETFGV